MVLFACVHFTLGFAMMPSMMSSMHLDVLEMSIASIRVVFE